MLHELHTKVALISFLGIFLFNTLAESGTTKVGQEVLLVSGKGSDITNNKAIMGKAKRKFITQKRVLGLIDVAAEKEDTDRQAAYWNTYHCQNNLVSSRTKSYGTYCKNRFCTVCCSIRKAEIINRYLPVIEMWHDPHFVTLTVKACNANRLKEMIGKVIEGFQRIKNKQKKRHQRGTGIKLVGVKSLECNFNPVKKTYNPHLHIIVPNREIADILVREWLKLWTPKFTSSKAQFTRKVDDAERDLIEIIKYGSKIFTEPDVNKKSKLNNSHQIYVAALDNILAAMKGKRIFERFGFNLPQSIEPSKPSQTELKDFDEWEYVTSKSDWENKRSEEVLTGYQPTPELSVLLSDNINMALD